MADKECGSQRPQILTFSSLYPNAAMPNFGVFVENRLRHLLATGEVEARVVAPVPWFPSRHPRFGAYARWASVPPVERRHGIEIAHPRYALPPKLGMLPHPFLLALGTLATLRRLRRGGFAFDLIDAHYFYPDGVAAVLLGAWLGRPVTISARGTDLNLYPQRFPLVRRMIAWATGRAAASIAVSGALAHTLVELGAPPDRVHVLRNGVDLDLFQPLERERTRRDLGLSGAVLASVGHLIERKGHHLVIEALAALPDCTLLVVGDGPERGALQRQADRLGVAGRVRFLGEVAHGRLAEVYGAADLLVLASSREGWPNVVLEAMACGTPVVAAPVEGVAEMVTAPAAGLILPTRTAAAIVAGVQTMLADPPARDATRRHAEGFSWDATTQGQLRLFRAAIATQARR